MTARTQSSRDFCAPSANSAGHSDSKAPRAADEIHLAGERVGRQIKLEKIHIENSRHRRRARSSAVGEMSDASRCLTFVASGRLKCPSAHASSMARSAGSGGSNSVAADISPAHRASRSSRGLLFERTFPRTTHVQRRVGLLQRHGSPCHPTSGHLRRALTWLRSTRGPATPAADADDHPGCCAQAAENVSSTWLVGSEVAGACGLEYANERGAREQASSRTRHPPRRAARRRAKPVFAVHRKCRRKAGPQDWAGRTTEAAEDRREGQVSEQVRAEPKGRRSRAACAQIGTEPFGLPPDRSRPVRLR